MNPVKSVIKGSPDFSKPMPKKEPFLEVAECFMDTIQGEGVNAGCPSVFLRMQHCMLNCQWCDSTEVWRRGNPYTINELIKLFDKEGVIRRLRDGHHLVLTGGSPLIQQHNLRGFIWTINLKYGFWPYVEVENECILQPSDDLISIVDCWNNSPKLANSGIPATVRYYQPDLLKFMSKKDNSWFKFVITSEKDLDEIVNDYLAKDLIRYDQIILMPEGADRKGIQENQEMVVKMAIESGFRYSPRLQVDIWDKATGV